MGCLLRATGGNVLPVFIFLLCKLIEELMPSILYSCFPVLFPSWLKGAVRGKVVCVRACVRERASVCMRVCVYV